ncbi:hypothetical protein I2F17_02060 [Acinetobacter sp. B10A]|uniref:hypothetical protein n=1 Tax=Acinetobacter baretiae TaxID=2605383 RepID=UPI001B3C64F8|nr:hypothetical protein [Acinetobacter baretiae]MBF7684618.1 hypothetical protein [Acinetobacter baretiae]
MLQQQRHLLHSMGVDVWIVKDTQPKNFSAEQFWRNQSSAFFELEDQQPSIIKQDLISEKDTRQKHIQIQTKVLDDLQKNEDLMHVESVLTPEMPQALVQQVIPPFTLILLSTDQYSLLLNVTEISVQEKIFLENLTYALAATSTNLHWPPNLPDFQQGCFANSYVKGFVDHVSLDKEVILLGQLPSSINLEVKKNMPSMTDIINDPTQKRALWAMIKNM